VINIGNFTSEDKSRYRPDTWTRRPGLLPPPRGPGLTGRVRTGSGARIRDLLGLALSVLLSRLAALPRQLGDQLFARNDAEAYMWGWQITRIHGGVGRRYRDPWFDTLAECGRCRGVGTAGGAPCLPCAGTGRVTLSGVI
jgi:hypothetical protein